MVYVYSVLLLPVYYPLADVCLCLWMSAVQAVLHTTTRRNAHYCHQQVTRAGEEGLARLTTTMEH